MTHTLLRQGVGCAMLACILGCSPALNWREVQVGRLVLLLPCKPDRAERTVQLADGNAPIEMVGCEADGALFAASHIRAKGVDHASALRQAWQTATFATMQAGSPVALPSVARAQAVPVQQWTANGIGADGKPVQAHMAWWVSGADVFHVAVYAMKLRQEYTETLFDQVKVR